MPCRALLALLAAAAVAPTPLAQTPSASTPTGPRTVAEASDHTATSRFAEVERFLLDCTGLEHGNRLALCDAGSSHEGRPLRVVRVALPDAPETPRLRAVVVGNIHAGEVEGKEALQALVREFAQGGHGDLLHHVELWLLPVYNVDGNEAFGTQHRAGQNGPDLVGRRANAQGLDLNRDFVKVDAPETRALLQLLHTVQPHLFVDLHTTNGSYHGYHLTFAPSLSPNVDPGIARATRAVLDAAQRAMQTAHGFATFDYGNFETRDWDGGGAPESATGVRGWWTYDHRARYGVNYAGLRHCVAVLSEAYSYADFATRIAATRAFVLELLRAAVAQRDALRGACEAAARRLATGERSWFGYDTGFGPAERLPVLVGAVDRQQSPAGVLRFVRTGEGTPEVMPVMRCFHARGRRALPAAWAVPAPSADLVDRLRVHGVRFEALDRPGTVVAQRFAVAHKRKPKRPYQGHQELVLVGRWAEAAPHELPAGTLWVPARQALAMLAATLLEPESEDSLSTWNFLEATTGEHYPVLRVLAE